VDSVTKTKLTKNQMARIVATALGSDMAIVAVTELTAGWYNTVYDLQLSDGRQIALKVAPSPEIQPMRCEIGLMRTEVEVMQRLADVGLPVPTLYAYDSSRELIGSEYFLMSVLSGQPYLGVKKTLSARECDAIESELGSMNRILNTIEGQGFGYYAQETHRSPSWPTTFYGLVADVLEDGRARGLTLTVDLDEIDRRVQDALACLSEVTQPCLIHWDLWDGNVFVERGKISGIIDFERALWADPLMEYYFSRQVVSPAFLRGYGRSVAAPSERRRRALYDLYFDLVLVTECEYRFYQDADHVRWTKRNFAEGWPGFLSAF